MRHTVGGWPKEFDHTEALDVAKYQKKMIREVNLGFKPATQDLANSAQKCIRQNNQIDLFEEYFAGEEAQNLAEAITAKTLMIFKDPQEIKRAVTELKFPGFQIGSHIGEWNLDAKELYPVYKVSLIASNPDS